MPIKRLFFDKNDHRLLEILNDVLDREFDRAQFKTLLTPYLRPRGIKELAASQGLRIAYAIVHLLNSLKSDQAQDRIRALGALRDEVFASSGQSLKFNRARVLIQIAKELIRAKGNTQKQLKLAHDFRMVALGKPHFLREQLRKYHLLEMPEEWNQLTFDDRVHDANSKGRKSATHLIMDAWVKGIRKLTVVYYNHVDPAVVSELKTAAQILDIQAQVGIEFRALFRDRFIKMVWIPNRLHEVDDITNFFENPDVSKLMQEGREAQQPHTAYVAAVAERFNSVHRQSIYQEFGVQLPSVDYDALAKSVDCGQPSLLHLAKYIHMQAMPLFVKRVATLREEYDTASYDGQASIAMQVESLNSLDADTILARYLVPEENQELPNPEVPAPIEELPSLSRLSPSELAMRLKNISRFSKLTLILADLRMEDVLEVLYDCQGRVDSFEAFNAKSMNTPQFLERIPFNELQRTLNDQNAVNLKKMIRDCIKKVLQEGRPDAEDRVEKLSDILNDFDSLRSYYKHSSLRTSMGSGSTGQSSRSIGMGFAVGETLPRTAQKELKKRSSGQCIPAHASTSQVVEFIPPNTRRSLLGSLLLRASRVPFARSLVCSVKSRWKINDFRIKENECGNILTLGGINPDEGNGLHLFERKKVVDDTVSMRYLNRIVVNCLKVLIGFIPAFLTFYLTKDWWVQAYLGGLIWFSITGLRNIIQSVLGGGGLHRSPYLRWNDYVSWDRIADSLFYTGFSVPLLDWLCKSVVLNDHFGIDTATAPLALYSIMALTNGVYITSHNLFRGLPHTAAFANFFRSVLSIPIAVVFNLVIGLLLAWAGSTNVDATLQLWAAVISKLASDCVAGVIEGLADRGQNIANRRWDYSVKLQQVSELFARLEVLHPSRNMLKTMREPKRFVEFSKYQETDYTPALIANALDLMYFRYYQPRAPEAFRQALENMSQEEREVLFASQQILIEEKTVARLFVDGLVGRNFTKALSFYLLRHRDYLKELERY